MSETETNYTCPQCGRQQTEKRNFCTYCGYSFLSSQIERPAKEPSASRVGPIPSATPPKINQRISARPYKTVSPRRFRFADRRVLFGLLGMLDFPILVAIILLWMGFPFAKSEPVLCDQIIRDEYTPIKYQTGLGGELDADTIFKADSEYVVQETLVVPKGFRLLIESGARLIFEKDAALEVQGELYVCGSEKSPVTFTSEGKEPGDWQGITLIDAGGESIISHALIQFAGDRAIYMKNSKLTLLDVKVANGTGFPISTDGNMLPQLLENVELDDNPFNGIEVRQGTVAEENVEWKNQGLPYVVTGLLEVDVNTTLTIEPGTVVKFWQAAKSNNPGIRVKGLLKAEDVLFTSIRDSLDEAGGVTYIESEDPGPGDWAGIIFQEASSKCYLRRAQVRYAGREQGAITMIASSPELTEVEVSDSAWYPLSADADSFPVLRSMTLSNNDPGNAMEIRGDSTISERQERTWEMLGEKDQIVRVVRGSLTIGPEATLTIEPGVVVKFENKSKLIIQGTLRALGEDDEEKGIVFTSLRDDDYGGQTAKATAPGDERGWDGIVFDQSDSSSILQNCIIRFGSIALNDASPRLLDNRILDSGSAALLASPSASPELRGNVLLGNDVDGMAIWKGSIKNDTTWPLFGEGDEQVVRILAGEVIVENDATLNIQPNVIIKANADGKLVIRGGLQALGRADERIIFTSLQDDSVGGDTNQKLEEPEAGDWRGIEAAEQAHILVEHAAVRFAQTGLIVHGRNAPVIDGWLKVSDGVNALWCDGEFEMPAGFYAENNENEQTGCPTQ